MEISTEKTKKEKLSDIERIQLDIDRMQNEFLDLVTQPPKISKKCRYYELHPEGVTQIYN